MCFTNFTFLKLKLNSITRLLNNLALLAVIIENNNIAMSNNSNKKIIKKLFKFEY